MRVAILTTSYPAFPGDPSGHFVETEARRRAATDEVTVIAARQGAGGARAPSASGGAGVVVLRLDGGGAFGWPGVASRIREHPRRLAGVALWMARARRALERIHADRIIAHWAVPSGFPVATGDGPPLEVVSHGADVRLLLGCPATVRRALVGRIVRRVDGWRFVSASLRDRLLAALDPSDARRVERVARVEASPIDMPDVSEGARANRTLLGAEHLAVCVARLVPGKRVDRVIDHVARERRTGCRLVVVGDGPLRASLEARARGRGVDALFLGRTTRPVALAWIGAADVLLHASEEEGLSTVLREAQALGVPVRFVGFDASVFAAGDLG